MQTRKLKDMHEEKVLFSLKEHLQLNQFSHTKGESPDFIIHHDSGDIGVEITELLDEVRKVRSSYKNKMTNKVIESLKDSLPYHFVLDINYETDTNRRPNNADRTRELVTIFVRLGKDLKDRGRIEFDRFDGDISEFTEYIQNQILANGFMPLPEGVSRISLSRFDILENSFNSQREGGLVPFLDYSKIQSEIDKKNDKYASYKKLFEQWLVLEEGNGMPGHYSGIPENEKFDSHFDRVFMVRIMRGEVIELMLKRVQ